MLSSSLFKGIKIRNNCANFSSEETVIILNGLHTGLFFVAFIISVPSLWLNFWYWKIKIKMEINETLFLVFPIVLTLFSCNESFQWVFLYSGSHIGGIACQVVATVREYAMMTLISLTTCFGVHLFIVVLQPKCLKVIDEVKRVRQKKLLTVYLVVSFISPVLFVPWPFVTGNYGSGYFMCWIANVKCKVDLKSVILDQVFLWHAWACVFSVFTILITAFTLFILCHSSGRGNLNVYAMLCFMTVFLMIVVLNIVSDILIWVKPPTLRLLLVVAVFTPLGNAFVNMVNIFRVFHHLRSIPRPIRAFMNGYSTIQ